MAEARLIETCELPIEAIDAEERLRPVSGPSVEALATSLRDVGLLHPVTVRALPAFAPAEKAILIGGAHRLAAAKRLGWATIRASVWRCGVMQARLMEVEENLQSAELTALDLAVHLAEQRRLYQKLNPQSARGRAGGLARQGQQVNSDSLAEILSGKRGVSARQILKYMSIGDRLDAELVATLRGLAAPPTLRDLATITDLPPDRRGTAAVIWASGAAKTAREATVRALNPNWLPPALQTKDDKAYDRLKAAWVGASERTRTLFIQKLCAEWRPGQLVFTPERDA